MGPVVQKLERAFDTNMREYVKVAQASQGAEKVGFSRPDGC